MIEVSGLWIHESKEGKKYFTGNMGKVRIVIFKNTLKKEGSNEPDYNMYFDEAVKKVVATSSSIDYNDIPF